MRGWVVVLTATMILAGCQTAGTGAVATPSQSGALTASQRTELANVINRECHKTFRQDARFRNLLPEVRQRLCGCLVEEIAAQTTPADGVNYGLATPQERRTKLEPMWAKRGERAVHVCIRKLARR